MEETERDKPAEPVEIPHTMLSADALQGVIDDFILREGTDYGSQETLLDTKREQVFRQLKADKIKLVYDPDSATVNLLTLDEWRRSTCASP